MIDTVSYATVLRAIGQALEGLGVASFHLEAQGEDYIVSGTATARPKKSFAGFFLRNGSWEWLSGWRSQQSKNKKRRNTTPSGPFELRYTPADVERLEGEGRAMRQNPSGMPDVYSLPQLLRAIGGYVDFRGSRMIGITRADRDFAVEYEGLEGDKRIETIPPSSLYGLAVRMYMHRSGRRQP